MGGRGSSSGLDSISNYISKSLPKEVPKLMLDSDYPELNGTERQIAWARKIRKELGEDLRAYVDRFDSYKKRSNGLGSLISNQIRQNRDNAIKFILNGVEKSNNKRQDLKEIVDIVSNYSDRVKRFNNIMSNTSASFWIDNRTEDGVNKKLRRKIDGR